MKKMLFAACVFGLVLLSSCGTQNKDSSLSTIASNSSSALPASASTSMSDSSYAPNQLVQPSSTLFSLSDTDAIIYDAAIRACSSTDMSTYVLLPNLSLVGTYQDDADNTCYVCKCHLHLYDFSEGQYQDDLPVGESILWLGIVVPQNNSEDVAVLESLDGSLWAESVRELCGPLTELADNIINNNALEVIRNIPAFDQEEALQLYLNTIS